jgi:hypothetical protein
MFSLLASWCYASMNSLTTNSLYLARFAPSCSSSELRECVLDAGDVAKLCISELRMLTDKKERVRAMGDAR